MQSLTRLARPVLARTSLPIRTFTTLSPLRPSLSPSAIRRPNVLTSFTPLPSTMTAAGEAATADVVPRGAVSSHPALAGVASQMRCGPRNTMNGHTRLVQKRRHGWLCRMRSRTGRKILRRRRLKGRSKVAW
ncbi:hypothetical protein K4F52_005582 [Lecanicillium sp. MT-2017a]|nr:hypothetical protein K4F52_005582 [Lecanicillium sp. MT-2017a]